MEGQPAPGRGLSWAEKPLFGKSTVLKCITKAGLSSSRGNLQAPGWLCLIMHLYTAATTGTSSNVESKAGKHVPWPTWELHFLTKHTACFCGQDPVWGKRRACLAIFNEKCSVDHPSTLGNTIRPDARKWFSWPFKFSLQLKQICFLHAYLSWVFTYTWIYFMEDSSYSWGSIQYR